MKSWTLVGVALAVALTACANMMRTNYSDEQPRTRGFSQAFVAAPNPTAPNVLIVGNKIVVDQEPVRPPGNQPEDPITIYFALPEGGPYTFPTHGIEITGHPNFCNPVTGSVYVFVCKYRRPAPDTIYKYVIRVKQDQGPPLKDLDPTIWN